MSYPKRVGGAMSNLYIATRWEGEEAVRRMADNFTRPEVCPKPGCKGVRFIRTEEGYQCLNCFKIIYDRTVKHSSFWELRLPGL